MIREEKFFAFEWILTANLKSIDYIQYGNNVKTTMMQNRLLNISENYSNDDKLDRADELLEFCALFAH